MMIDDNPNDETTENYEDDEYDDEALSQSELDDIETANEAREWVALLSDPVRALAWAEKQARSMVARFPERDLETELAKWRAVAEAGVEGSGIETEGL